MLDDDSKDRPVLVEVAFRDLFEVQLPFKTNLLLAGIQGIRDLEGLIALEHPHAANQDIIARLPAFIGIDAVDGVRWTNLQGLLLLLF
ncbi:hypothetical protein D9M71_607090 [compost metagenome]